MTNQELIYMVAKQEYAKGIMEFPGSKHHPDILKYHDATSFDGDTDEVPWCASFCCWVIEEAGFKSTGSAGARSYDKWGEAVSLSEIREGDIVTMNTNGRRHVGFFHRFSSDPEGFYMLGGNQSNRLQISKFKRKYIAHVRRVA